MCGISSSVSNGAAPEHGIGQDVPITALAVNLERDLLELVDVNERPAKPAPVDGYLW